MFSSQSPWFVVNSAFSPIELPALPVGKVTTSTTVFSGTRGNDSYGVEITGLYLRANLLAGNDEFGIGSSIPRFTVYGGAGTDQFSAPYLPMAVVDMRGPEADLAVLGTLRLYGFERFSFYYGSVNFYGDERANRLNSNRGADLVYGGDGNDTISTLWASDTIYGGGGNDLIEPGGDADVVYGGAGIDTLTYQVYTGVWDGEGLSISLRDADVSGQGSDGEIVYGVENVIGGSNDDDIGGNLQANALQGMGGNDTLQGYEGRDRLNGGAGDDLVYGGAGNDRIYLSAGADTVFGGQGSDRFILNDSAGTVRIEDFNVRQDVLVLGGGFLFGSAEEARHHTYHDLEDTWFYLPGDARLQLVGIDATELAKMAIQLL